MIHGLVGQGRATVEATPLVVITREDTAAALAQRAAHRAVARQSHSVDVLYLHVLPIACYWEPNLLTNVWAEMTPTAKRIEQVVTNIMLGDSVEPRFFAFPGEAISRVTHHVRTHNISEIIFAEQGTSKLHRWFPHWPQEICWRQLHKAMPTVTLFAVPVTKSELD